LLYRQSLLYTRFFTR